MSDALRGIQYELDVHAALAKVELALARKRLKLTLDDLDKCGFSSSTITGLQDTIAVLARGLAAASTAVALSDTHELVKANEEMKEEPCARQS